jgi:hypothetical protein
MKSVTVVQRAREYEEGNQKHGYNEFYSLIKG